MIAESFERIHRSNLVGMGVLPLQFLRGESAASLGLTGEEVFAIDGARRRDGRGAAPREVATVHRARRPASSRSRVRIDTPMEVEYFRHGGILQYVLRDCSPPRARRLR